MSTFYSIPSSAPSPLATASLFSMLDFCFEYCFFPYVTLESCLFQSWSDGLENNFFFWALILKVPLKLIYAPINQQALSVILLCHMCQPLCWVLIAQEEHVGCSPLGGPRSRCREERTRNIVYSLVHSANIYCTPKWWALFWLDVRDVAEKRQSLSVHEASVPAEIGDHSEEVYS